MLSLHHKLNKKTKSVKEIIKDKIVPIPYISEVTYLAKNKKVKLSYHKDVRDIIKDIYKHV